MPKKPVGLQELLVEQLQDLYDAEKQLVKSLPKMAKGANDQELENAFREHLEVTRGQVQRLEEVFQAMDMRARSRPCAGMKGIIEEGNEILAEEMEPGIQDTGVAAAGRKVEHYEIAGYESARAVAQQLGMREAAGLLEQTLQEEVQTDRLLTQICKRLLKESSTRRGEAEQVEQGRGGGARRTSQSSRSGRGSSQRGSGNGGRASSRSGGGSSRRGRSQQSGGSAHPLTDHEEIRQWAEERGGQPACVRGTGGKGDTGMIRLDFPGYSGDESLEHISWEDWFEKFDENGLALMVQERTAGGEQSNFNKLVSRETAQERSKPKTRAAR